MPNMLSIGGFDPSGASGVQRDGRLAASMGFHPLSVATAITAQNTSSFGGVHALPAEVVREQLDAVTSDFEIDAIKVGMLWDSEIMEVVAEALGGAGAPAVLDPVVRSTTGGPLLRPGARDTLLDAILPLSHAVTPNLAEAQYLAGIDEPGIGGARRAAELLRGRGAPHVVVTGIVCGDRVIDVLHDGSIRHIGGPRLGGSSRGGGCAYSAALACLLAGGSDMADAAAGARRIALDAISAPLRAGRGLPVASEGAASGLASAIGEVSSLPGMASMIPQCQTNFVYAPADAVLPEDVYGIRGRLVRAGGRVVMAGGIAPGGSKHVASAVCAIRSRFPDVRAAINIRYSPDVVSKMIRERFVVAFYDRTDEPPQVKESGSSVAWGVDRAAAGCAQPPDAICHRGDVGKEPMTLLFGKTPQEVAAKVRRLCS